MHILMGDPNFISVLIVNICLFCTICLNLCFHIAYKRFFFYIVLLAVEAMSVEKEPCKIRLLTYLFPGLPIELYQTYQYYLEEVLGCAGYLSVETRWSSPPSGRVDPFTDNEADIGMNFIENTMCQLFLSFKMSKI